MLKVTSVEFGVFFARPVNKKYISLTHTHTQSHNYFTTGGLPPIISSWRQAPLDSRHSNFIFQLNSCMRRGWVCRLELLLVLTSAVILRSESPNDHILLSRIRDSPKLKGQAHLFISCRNRVAQLYPQVLASLSVASYD
jgi:hypothetical protein